MMIGETRRSYPTVQVPQWDFSDDSMVNNLSPFSVNRNSNAVSFKSEKCALTALQCYVPSNMNTIVGSTAMEDCDIPLEAFTCDHFRMYDFKVRRCARARSHDWTECPYAHPGEKARRRDPRKFHYSGTPCPDFRKGQCIRGDGCESAHGVFECWLHPARYRTQPCKDGTFCRRKVCFFAHTPDQLRLLPASSPTSHSGVVNESYIDSPSLPGMNSSTRNSVFGLSPTSTLYSPPSSPPNESPPMSPCGSIGYNSVSSLSGSMRSMQIGEFSSGRMSMSPPTWGVQMGSSYGSPRHISTLRPGLFSVPVTPTRSITRSGLGVFDLWDHSCEDEQAMERVESGRDLRAKMYAKLSKENSLVRVESPVTVPDFGWVSELVK